MWIFAIWMMVGYMWKIGVREAQAKSIDAMDFRHWQYPQRVPLHLV
jgi:hypothetical protein